MLEIKIPNYIREVEISKKRRKIYYEWQASKGIRARKSSGAKGKQLPKKFILKEYHDPFIYNNDTKIRPNHLSPKYSIALVVGSSIKLVFDKTYEEHRIAPMVAKYKSFAFNNGFITEKMKAKAKLYLYDNDKKELVLSNPKVAGTPNNYVINGQDFYSGNLNPLVRAKVVTNIKQFFADCIKYKNITPINPSSYPLTVVCEVHDTIKNKYDKSSSEIGTGWDIGNRAYLPYLKTMLDLLVTGKVNKEQQQVLSPVLKEDDRLHIRGEGIIFVPIKDAEESKLIFKFYKSPF
jgi:hypothetical protein